MAGSEVILLQDDVHFLVGVGDLHLLLLLFALCDLLLTELRSVVKSFNDDQRSCQVGVVVQVVGDDFQLVTWSGSFCTREDWRLLSILLLDLLSDLLLLSSLVQDDLVLLPGLA